MRPIHRHAAAVLGLVALAWLAAAATWQGHSVDRHRFHGTLTSYDYGAFDNVEARFQGDHVYVTFAQGGRIVLLLDDEEIEDPHRIPCHDPKRGIGWELDIKDMGAR